MNKDTHTTNSEPETKQAPPYLATQPIETQVSFWKHTLLTEILFPKLMSLNFSISSNINLIDAPQQNLEKKIESDENINVNTPTPTINNNNTQENTNVDLKNINNNNNLQGPNPATQNMSFKTLFEKELENLVNFAQRDLPADTKTLNADPIKHLEWLSNHGKISVIEEKWLSHIVGERVTAVGFKVKGRGEQEDFLYSKNDTLRRDCPRGVVFVKQTLGLVKGRSKDEKPDEHVTCSLFGVRKFFAKRTEGSAKAASKTLQEGKYSYIVPTTKANGDMCQVAVFQRKVSRTMPKNTGEIIWIIGSKNRKIAVTQRSHINDYLKETCYAEHATKMAHSFFDYLDAMGAEKAKQLKYFLLATGLTINLEFECVEMQHIVPLDKTRLVLIGITGRHIPGAQGIHPFLSASVARYFGFPSVFDWDHLQIYEKSQLEDLCAKLVTQWNTEGAVLVLLDEQMRTVDLAKVKSWQYTLLRATREKLRRSKEVAETHSIAIIERFAELAKSMQISSAFLDPFVKLAPLLVKWLIRDPSRKRLALLQNNFPSAYVRFLQDCSLPLDSSLLTANLDAVDPPKLTTPLLVSKPLTTKLPNNNNNNNNNNASTSKKKKKKKKKR